MALIIKDFTKNSIMVNSSKQKIRLMFLYDLLRKNTDEENPMPTNTIISTLKQQGFSISRKTLYEDIELLNKNGYEVLCKKSRSNCYFVVDRAFELAEVQMLLSAVGANKSLSDKKANALMNKLYDLLGVADAEKLNDLIAVTKKHSNERVYYSIDAITTAIMSKKKLSFFYFDYNLNNEKVYRKNKTRYEVNPLGLVYSDDKMYLICYHDKYCNSANYRLDRMEEVKVEDTPIISNKRFNNFDINVYKYEQFSMYGGAEYTVDIVFPIDLLEVARDRFGKDIRFINIGSGEFLSRVKIQVSKTFFAWLTTFEGKVKINAPQEVKKLYENFIINLYNRL